VKKKNAAKERGKLQQKNTEGKEEEGSLRAGCSDLQKK